jgi:hypothetical protein
MENFRVSEETPIENDLVNQALDKVQTQIEEFQRVRRIQLYRLDETVSSQRASIYSQRRAILTLTDSGTIVLVVCAVCIIFAFLHLGITEMFKSFAFKTMEEIFAANTGMNEFIYI